MGTGGQHHSPAALPPGKTRYPLYRRLGGAGLDGCGKSRPPPGFDPLTVQSVASRYTDWAIPAANLSNNCNFTLHGTTCLKELFFFLRAAKGVWRRVCCKFQSTCIINHLPFPCFTLLPWRWRQKYSPTRWEPRTKVQDFTLQKTVTQ